MKTFLMALGFLSLVQTPVYVEAKSNKKYWSSAPVFKDIKPNSPIRHNSYSRVVQKLAPAVVDINVTSNNPKKPIQNPTQGAPKKQDTQQGMGTGFIIHSDGYILTNYHVVANAVTIKVKLLHQGEIEAQLIGEDPVLDLALLKIAPSKKYSIAPLGNSDKIKIGSHVMAIGNPFGFSSTATVGIISAKGRREVYKDEPSRIYDNFIQTDTAINPGNSGGPLLNLKGQVIGVNTAIKNYAQGIGFAIPINMVKLVIPQFIQYGKVRKGWIGANIVELTADLAYAAGQRKPQGAFVTFVSPRGPAFKAGLKSNDIILKFNKQKIHRSAELPWIAAMAGIGSTVPVHVFRKGQYVNLKLKIGERSKKSDTRTGSKAVLIKKLGIYVENIPDTMSEHLKVPKGTGLLIIEMQTGSKAQNAGLQKDDVILQVNGKPLDSAATLEQLLSSPPSGDQLKLLVKRGPSKRFVYISTRKN